jgi:hypothetical protein
MTPTLPLPPFGYRLIVKAPVATQCLAIRPARIWGRGDRVPPKNHLPRILGASSLKARYPRLALASEGRAPHARGDGLRLTGACALSATRRSFGPDYHVVPRLDYGLGIQTRRPRPSEKIALRVVPGFPPRGHPTLAGPPLGGGGLRTPEGNARA